MAVVYDFTDPAILSMVQLNHLPEEVVVVNADGSGGVTAIVCALDRQPWPCPAVLALRTYQTANPVTSPGRGPGFVPNPHPHGGAG